jgi:hypothetical protein
MDFLWEKERLQNNHSLPSYYELCLIVRDELHDSILEPFAGFFALLGIGHFFTPTGRYYWKVVLNNYKIFLCVCLGIWTDEAVEAYEIEEKSVNLSVDGRAFLYKNEETTLAEKYEEKKSNSSKNRNKNINNAVCEVSPLSRSSPSRRKLSAQVFGVTINRKNMTDSSDQSRTERNLPQKRSESEKQNMREVLPAIISVLICSRVILFQVVPSLVLFATVSMTLASFPLFIFNDFLVETLPPLIIYGVVNREMAIEKELQSFVALHLETKEVLSEAGTIRVLSEEYSWRLFVRGIILFWNESRLLQFIQSSLTLFFSFLLLIYTRELLVYLIVILGILFLFILSNSLVLLLYLGSSLDVKDSDFPGWLRVNHPIPMSSTAVASNYSERQRTFSGSLNPPSGTVHFVAREQKQIEEDLHYEDNNGLGDQKEVGHKLEVEPQVILQEVENELALPENPVEGNHESSYTSPVLKRSPSYQEEGEDMSSLDIDDFEFSDETPSIKEEEEQGAERDYPSVLSSRKLSVVASHKQHKTEELSLKRIYDEKEQSSDRNGKIESPIDRKSSDGQNHQSKISSTINNEVDASYSAVNNFPEKQEHRVTNPRIRTVEKISSPAHQVSDSEENSDSDDEQDDDLEEYMHAYLQTGEMDLESGFSTFSLKK